jgi:hypothetical protein
MSQPRRPGHDRQTATTRCLAALILAGAVAWSIVVGTADAAVVSVVIGGVVALLAATRFKDDDRTQKP